MHAAIYEHQEDGPPVTAEQLLAGLVDPPLEFRPLYQALHELAGTAQVRAAALGACSPDCLPACLPVWDPRLPA